MKRPVFYEVMKDGIADNFELRVYSNDEQAKICLAVERSNEIEKYNYYFKYRKKTVKELNTGVYRATIVGMCFKEGARFLKVKYFNSSDLRWIINHSK